MDETKKIQQLEALLLLENNAVENTKIKKLLGTSIEKIEHFVALLNKNYEKIESVFSIKQIESTYKLTLKTGLSENILENYSSKKKKLPKTTLETLAIIAYKQPTTRGEIENIRGVASGQHIGTLLERDLVKIAGRKEGPGKPHLYKTTPQFLEHFGLKTLGELPKLKEVKEYAFLEEKDFRAKQNEKI